MTSKQRVLPLQNHSRAVNMMNSSRSVAVHGSKLSNSASRRNVGQGGSSSGVGQLPQVFFHGKNVTPQSLLQTVSKDNKYITRDGKDSNAVASKGESNSDAISQDSSLSINSDHISTTSFNKSRGNLGNLDSDDENTISGENNDLERNTAQEIDSQGISNSQAAVTINENEKRKQENLNSNEPVTTRLSETTTCIIFQLHSVCVAQDAEEHSRVTARNKLYTKICTEKNVNDIYREHHAQTLNLAQKNQEVMAAPPATRDTACVATEWDIYDCRDIDADENGNERDDTNIDSNKGVNGINSLTRDNYLSKHAEEIVATSLASQGCLLDVDADFNQGQGVGNTSNEIKTRSGKSSKSNSSSNSLTRKSTRVTPNNSKTNNLSGSQTSNLSENGSKEQIQDKVSINIDKGNFTQPGLSTASTLNTSEIIAQRNAKKILSSPSLMKNLLYVERAVQQNIYHQYQLKYRNFPTIITREERERVEANGTNSNPLHFIPQNQNKSKGLSKLWDFSCSITAGRTVSCMAWNTVNEDLLVVSYGQFEFSNQKDGLVLFWSLKNPEYPERIYKMKDGATALDFSTAHPNLLAVGFYHGVVAIYDIRKEEDIPILESSQGSGSHMDVVWQVKWVNKGSERGESLVSISVDGRITEWSIKKGLTSVDLMLLKRIVRHNLDKTIGDEGVISRQASGHCIDFAKNDTSVYFAGTEDGVIHKCSCSYNEQYLESYFGHTGPVYHLRISPFWDQVFLSCSSDWTMKLWNQKNQNYILNFHSVDLSHAVHDITWSPSNSTVFACATADGRIQFWDLEQSILDPIFTYNTSCTNTGSTSLDVETTGKKEPVAQTTILFARTAPVLVVGTANGNVGVYQVSLPANSLVEDLSMEDQIERLKKAIYQDDVLNTE